MPMATGSAVVSGEKGYIHIDARFDKLAPPAQFGREYLTYVLWAITPEGRATNLGEVQRDDDDARVKVTTELQAFGLILTAEPYFAVTQPSDVVVMENVAARQHQGPRRDHPGQVRAAEARLVPDEPGRRAAQHQAARTRRAARSRRGAQRRGAGAAGRRGSLRGRHVQQGRGAAERRRAGAREAPEQERHHDAGAAGGADGGRRAARRPAAAGRGVPGRAAPHRAGARGGRARPCARRGGAAAAGRAERAGGGDGAARRRSRTRRRPRRSAPTRSARRPRPTRRERRPRPSGSGPRRPAQQAEAERAARRGVAARRRGRGVAGARRGRARPSGRRPSCAIGCASSSTSILETRETARGLIVNLSDVLFDTAQATLKPGAREKLARVSGILVTHPDLKIEIEGHTDSVGSDDYNQGLSERRAESVRSYLVSQRIAAQTITTAGLRREPSGGHQRHGRGPAAEPPRRARRVGRGHRHATSDATGSEQHHAGNSSTSGHGDPRGSGPGLGAELHRRRTAGGERHLPPGAGAQSQRRRGDHVGEPVEQRTGDGPRAGAERRLVARAPAALSATAPARATAGRR